MAVIILCYHHRQRKTTKSNQELVTINNRARHISRCMAKRTSKKEKERKHARFIPSGRCVTPLQHSRPIYSAFIVVVHGNTGNLCDGIHGRLIRKAELVTVSEILLLVEILQ